MVKIGQKVRFIPRFCFLKEDGRATAYKKIVVSGSVIFANPLNEFFVAEYTLNGVRLREGFQFFDIGRVIRLER